MSSFIGSKFDSINDPDRPRVGEIVVDPDRKFKIMKVSYALQSEIFKKTLRGEWYDAGDDADEVLAKDHVTRPGVVWLVWAKNIV